jgi:hypothetical protein
MMKLMCDCGCGHPITAYDAGQMPVIVRRGSLLVELRVIPAASGVRPNIRPFCARNAVADGEIVFPLPGRAMDATVAGVPDTRVRSISAKLDQAGEAKLDRAEEGTECAGRPGKAAATTATSAVGVVGNGSTW